MSKDAPAPPYRPQLAPASGSGPGGPGTPGSCSNPWSIPAHKLTDADRAFLDYMRARQRPQPAPAPQADAAPPPDLPPHIRPWP